MAPLTSLGRLRAIFVAIRNITGDLVGGTVPPPQKYRTLIGKGRPNNSLRLIGAHVAARMDAGRARFAKDLREALAKQGIAAEVRALEAPGAIIPWPPSEVAVLIPIGSLESLAVFDSAANAARASAHECMNVIAIPVIAGRLAPTWAKSGFGLMVNLPGRAAEWPARLGMPAFMPVASLLFDAVVSCAASLQSMDHLSLGTNGRPTAEVEARAALEAHLASGRDQLASAITPLNAAFTAAARNILDEIRFGEENYLDAAHAAINKGAVTHLVRQVGLLRILFDQAEMEVGQ